MVMGLDPSWTAVWDPATETLVLTRINNATAPGEEVSFSVGGFTLPATGSNTPTTIALNDEQGSAMASYQATSAPAATSTSTTTTAAAAPSSLSNATLGYSSSEPNATGVVLTTTFQSAQGVQVGDTVTLSLPGFNNSDAPPMVMGLDPSWTAVWDPATETLVLTRINNATAPGEEVSFSVGGFTLPATGSNTPTTIALNDEQGSAMASYQATSAPAATTTAAATPRRSTISNASLFFGPVGSEVTFSFIPNAGLAAGDTVSLFLPYFNKSRDVPSLSGLDRSFAVSWDESMSRLVLTRTGAAVAPMESVTVTVDGFSASQLVGGLTIVRNQEVSSPVAVVRAPSTLVDTSIVYTSVAPNAINTTFTARFTPKVGVAVGDTIALSLPGFNHSNSTPTIRGLNSSFTAVWDSATQVLKLTRVGTSVQPNRAISFTVDGFTLPRDVRAADTVISRNQEQPVPIHAPPSTLSAPKITLSSELPNATDVVVTARITPMEGLAVGDTLTISLPGLNNSDSAPVVSGIDAYYTSFWDAQAQTLVLTRTQAAVGPQEELELSISGFTVPPEGASKVLQEASIARNQEEPLVAVIATTTSRAATTVAAPTTTARASSLSGVKLSFSPPTPGATNATVTADFTPAGGMLVGDTLTISLPGFFNPDTAPQVLAGIDPAYTAAWDPATELLVLTRTTNDTEPGQPLSVAAGGFTIPYGDVVTTVTLNDEAPAAVGLVGGSTTSTAAATPAPTATRTSIYNFGLSYSSRRPNATNVTVTATFVPVYGLAVGDVLTLTLPGFKFNSTAAQPPLQGLDRQFSTFWNPSTQTLVLTRLPNATAPNVPISFSAGGFTLPDSLSGLSALLALNDEQPLKVKLADPVPYISQIEPEAGAIGLQAQLTIHGVNFRPDARIFIGDKPCLAIVPIKEGAGIALTCTTVQTVGYNFPVTVVNTDSTSSNKLLLSFWKRSPLIVTKMAMSVLDFDTTDQRRIFRLKMQSLLDLGWMYQIYIVGVRPGSCVVEWRVLNSEAQPEAHIFGPERLQAAAEDGRLANVGLGITEVTVVGTEPFIVAAAPGPATDADSHDHDSGWLPWQIAIVTLACLFCCCCCCLVLALLARCQQDSKAKSVEVQLAQLETPRLLPYATTVWPAKSARDDDYNTTIRNHGRTPSRTPMAAIKDVWGAVVTPRTRAFKELWGGALVRTPARSAYLQCDDTADVEGGNPTFNMFENHHDSVKPLKLATTPGSAAMLNAARVGGGVGLGGLGGLERNETPDGSEPVFNEDAFYWGPSSGWASSPSAAAAGPNGRRRSSIGFLLDKLRTPKAARNRAFETATALAAPPEVSPGYVCSPATTQNPAVFAP